MYIDGTDRCFENTIKTGVARLTSKNWRQYSQVRYRTSSSLSSVPSHINPTLLQPPYIKDLPNTTPSDATHSSPPFFSFSSLFPLHIQDLNCAATDATIDEAMAKLDTDQNGSIDFTEFALWYTTCKERIISDATNCFKKFDIGKCLEGRCEDESTLLIHCCWWCFHCINPPSLCLCSTYPFTLPILSPCPITPLTLLPHPRYHPILSLQITAGVLTWKKYQPCWKV